MTVCVILTALWIINIKRVSDLLFQKIDPKKKTIHHDLTNIIFYTKKNFKLFYYLQIIKKLGFLTEFFKGNLRKSRNLEKQGILKRNILKKQGILVIKEYFKKQGILKPGNF